MPDVRLTIRQNVIAAVKALTGQAGVERKDAQTWLINHGMRNGNAQRLLGADTDYGITRLDEAAKLLRTTPHALVTPGQAPLINAAGAEVLLATELARLPESPDKARLIAETLRSIADLMPQEPPRAEPPQPTRATRPRRDDPPAQRGTRPPQS